MTTLREETIAKEIFAEFIFAIYHLNCKNLIRKNIQNWSTAETNSAFLLKKPEQLRST